MPQITYIGTGMAGMLNSSLELCARLKAAGHSVTYVTHADITLPVEELDIGLRRVGAASEITRSRRESLVDNEIPATLASLQPDLLVIEIEAHRAIIESAELRIPTVLVAPWFSVFRRPGLPPMNTGLMPPATSWGRVVVGAAWWWTRGQARLLRAKQYLKTLLRPRPVPFNTANAADVAALARSQGYSLATNTDRTQWLRPHVYTTLPILAFVAEEMEFPHRSAPTMRYVGPMVKVDRVEPRLGKDDVARWEAFLLRRRGDAPRGSLVYCSLGSYWPTDRDFLNRLVDVFRRRGDWDLVIGLGGKSSPADLGRTPDNVLILDWAPQMEVLAEADCAVTHAGIGTINECLALGVPMVVYSTGHVDQDGCAARVEYHGVGLRGSIGSATPKDIESKIQAVLTDTRMHERVARMQQIVDSYRRPDRAVAAIEEYL